MIKHSNSWRVLKYRKLATRTTPRYNFSHRQFQRTLGEIYLNHQAVNYADFKDMDGEVYLKVNFMINLFLITILRTRGNMMNARSTSKHCEEAKI